MAGTVTPAGTMREGHLANPVQKITMVDDPTADNVDDVALLLHPALHSDHRGGHYGAALGLEAVRLEDAFGDAGLVLDGNEQHTLGAARLLTNADDAGDLDMATVPDRGEIGTASRTTREWMRHEYPAHRLSWLGLPEGASERQARFLMLDVNIANDKDKKAKWRRSLAWRARTDQIVNTDKACEDRLDANYGRVPDDLTFPRPSGSPLRCWVRRLIKGGRKLGSLVSQAGRPRNHSQLEPEVDAAVTSAALFFYSAIGIDQVMAESYLQELIDTLNAALPAGRIVPYKQPSSQTLRARIFKLECWDKRVAPAVELTDSAVRAPIDQGSDPE